jgi:predicted AAA+ superfamily ATPase
MDRLIYNSLKKWKNQEGRKSLLIRGARQVGKTHVVRQLGKTFSNFVEINFELTPEAKQVFEQDLSPQRIIRDLSLMLGQKIIPRETLLFFDEIQVALMPLLLYVIFMKKCPTCMLLLLVHYLILL